MNDLEQVLRRTLQDQHLGSELSSDDMLARVVPRVRRRRRVRSAGVVAGVSLAAAGAFATGQWLSPGPGVVTRTPAASSSLSVPAVTAAPDLVVPGVPGSLRRVADPLAALRAEPALTVRPTGGVTAFVRASGDAPVDRLVAVGQPGQVLLPGDDPEPAWLGQLRGTKALVTDEGRTRTAYLQLWTPGGASWLVVVSGGDETARLAVLESVATAISRTG
jgi:hypothetical protein